MKISPPPRSTRTDTPFPYQTPFRSPGVVEPAEADAGPAPPGRLQQVRHARAPRALPVPLLPVADEEALVRAQPQALHDPQQPFRVGLQPVDVGIAGRYMAVRRPPQGPNLGLARIAGQESDRPPAPSQPVQQPAPAYHTAGLQKR